MIDGWEWWLRRDPEGRLRRLTARLHPPQAESDRARHITLADHLPGLLAALDPGALHTLELEVEAGYRDSFVAQFLESDRAASVAITVRERWVDAGRKLTG